MVKNNHLLLPVNNLYDTLNDHLLQQPFAGEEDPSRLLQQGQSIARMYARMENAISVLSDMHTNKSYIYHKGMAAGLGLPALADGMEIDSIWEKDILDRIHPDDLLQKHSLELQFFLLLKDRPAAERADYQVLCRLRMRDSQEEYVPVLHRMFYLPGGGQGSIRLALCLYNRHYEPVPPEGAEGMIVHTREGKLITPGQEQVSGLLSAREKEILWLIREGKRSKEIAGLLSISGNTVSRHRQNILEKLKVSNSIEACKVAEKLRLI